jgi:hypothetical protein
VVEVNRELVLRTGGFGLYFLSTLALLFVSVLLFNLDEVLSRIIDLQWLFIICMIFYIYLMVYLIAFICSHKIKLTDDELSVRVMKKFLVYQTDCMTLTDIEHIYLGFDTFLYSEIQDPRGQEALRTFFDQFNKRRTLSTPITFVIRTKDGELHPFSTKPYSKRGFQKLFEELRKRTIETVVGKNIL